VLLVSVLAEWRYLPTAIVATSHGLWSLFVFGDGAWRRGLRTV
jgi:hypothetical protein